MSAGTLLLTSTLGPLLLVSLLALEGSSSIDAQTMQTVLVYSLAMFVAVTMVLPLALLWLWLLGYELVTIRDQLADCEARSFPRRRIAFANEIPL